MYSDRLGTEDVIRVSWKYTYGIWDNIAIVLRRYGPGWGALGSEMTGMCGPKSGGRKMTLTVTLRDIKRDPYSDLNVDLIPLH